MEVLGKAPVRLMTDSSTSGVWFEMGPSGCFQYFMQDMDSPLATVFGEIDALMRLAAPYIDDERARAQGRLRREDFAAPFRNGTLDIMQMIERGAERRISHPESFWGRAKTQAEARAEIEAAAEVRRRILASPEAQPFHLAVARWSLDGPVMEYRARLLIGSLGSVLHPDSVFCFSMMAARYFEGCFDYYRRGLVSMLGSPRMETDAPQLLLQAMRLSFILR